MTFKNGFRKKAEDIGIQKLNQLNLPNAMLIIPDGNGRWAKNLGLDIFEGHKAGGRTFSEILNHFIKLNVKYLGVWGFSEDNWKRPTDEIAKIMEVIESVIKENLEVLLTNNIKFISLGRVERIEKEFPSLFKTIEETTQKTSANTNKVLALFIDYGEKFELEEFAKERAKDKSLKTYEILSKINKGLPLFDMVLRTSGEQRLSGFGPLVSLAEFVSVKKNLPEINDKDIINALREFSKRKRRFGART